MTDQIEDGIMKVLMLGSFQIDYKGITITSSDISSPMLLKLMSYVLYHHNRKTTSWEIIQNIWGMEELENHKGSLKSLVYRLRVLLRKYWPHDEFLITDFEGYHWNPDIDVLLDTDILEKGNVGTDIQLDSGRLECLLDAYKGKFMTECDDFYWVMYMRVYYHNKFVHFVTSYCNILKQRNDYTEIVDITRNFLKIDTMEEEFHYWLIYALIKQKKFTHASQMYEEALRYLYNDEETEISGQMRYLKSLIESSGRTVETEYDNLVYEILNLSKDAYILEKKKEKLAAVISINLCNKTCLASMPACGMNRCAETFEKLLLNNVRMNDVVIKNTNYEYIIVLKHCDENGAESLLSILKLELDRELTLEHKQMIEFTSKVIEIHIS